MGRPQFGDQLANDERGDLHVGSDAGRVLKDERRAAR